MPQMQKIVRGVVAAPAGHWVGDGFPVRSLFSYDKLGQYLSPFLLLDYAGPAQFTPAGRPRGVGEHPHRGFETVTIVYSGEVAHRDSSGGGGTIGPGDVQWMTAASGILHDEFHSAAFTRTGGTLEMAQLWVNLPAKHKLSAPGYQNLLNADIPQVELPEGAGRVRVIAGSYAGAATQPAAVGPARTFTDLNVWDVRLRGGARAAFRLSAGHTTALAVLKGALTVNGAPPAGPAALVVLDRAGEDIMVEAAPGAEAVFLLLSGAPIDEPVVGYGPFVMNSREEIEAAMDDFRRGSFGTMPVAVRLGEHAGVSV
jgi:redox-sensitive bicupin YhaK (pirin superfamily)